MVGAEVACAFEGVWRAQRRLVGGEKLGKDVRDQAACECWTDSAADGDVAVGFEAHEVESQVVVVGVSFLILHVMKAPTTLDYEVFVSRGVECLERGQVEMAIGGVKDVDHVTSLCREEQIPSGEKP